jgi:hypothetical protein
MHDVIQATHSRLVKLDPLFSPVSCWLMIGRVQKRQTIRSELGTDVSQVRQTSLSTRYAGENGLEDGR